MAKGFDHSNWWRGHLNSSISVFLKTCRREHVSRLFIWWICVNEIKIALLRSASPFSAEGRQKRIILTHQRKTCCCLHGRRIRSKQDLDSSSSVCPQMSGDGGTCPRWSTFSHRRSEIRLAIGKWMGLENVIKWNQPEERVWFYPSTEAWIKSVWMWKTEGEDDRAHWDWEEDLVCAVCTAL